MSEPVKESFANMSLVEHLVELRVRVTRALLGVIVGTCIAFYFSEQIMMILRAPVLPYLKTTGLIFTAPMDKFMAYVKVSCFAGLIMTTPWWFYQLWKFISPGLYLRERRYALAFISTGSIFFLTGCVFAYFVALPAAFEFLFTFGGTEDQAMITIGEYLSFLVITILMFGVSFEIPLVIVILGLLGVVNAKFLRAKRRYAIVLLAILSAVLTPPDAVSMLMMLVPMIVFYEISIFVVLFFEKQKLKKQQSPD